MEVQLRLVRSVATEIQRTLGDGVNVERMDVLLTLAERLLRSFAVVLTVQPTPLMQECVDVTQGIVRVLSTISSTLMDRNAEPCGYYPPVIFTGALGRPKISITHAMLRYFFSHGFSASTIAMLLQVSLSTVRRRMSEFGIMARDLYSRISDSELDRVVTSVQHEHPNSGYRMMQGYVARLGHRVQQTRIRESMARTDPDGVLSRWFTAVHRRSYYVSTPNALWHIDGHHRLIR
jgi:hypothetical protein